jgi:hypothetical protein
MNRYDLDDLNPEGDDDIFALSDAVGPRKRNRRHDVLKIETLFANTGDHDLEDGPTGYAGSQLDQAIRAFQKRRGLAVDGVLEPGGETIAALESELGGRLDGFRAPRPDEADDHLNRGGRGEEGLFAVGSPPPILHAIDNLPPIGPGAWQSNKRTVRALFTTRDNGPLADLLADAIGHDGLDGVAEVRDLLDQARDRDPARADAMARAVFDRLSEKDQALFSGGDQPERRPIGVMKLGDGGYRASDGDGPDQRSSVQLAQMEEPEPARGSDTALERPFTYADDPLRRKEHLDRADRWIDARIKDWRQRGWHQAADNLERYRSGSGEPLKFGREQARSFPQIRDLEAENRKHFEEKSFVAREGRSEFLEALRTIKDGEERKLPAEHWDAAYGTGESAKDVASGEGGFYWAFGRTSITSGTVEMTARRNGDTIRLHGTIEHRWGDKYSFDPHAAGSGPPLLMERHRGAKPFDIDAAWRQRVEGVVRIEGDKLVPVGPFKWTDIDHDPGIHK